MSLTNWSLTGYAGSNLFHILYQQEVLKNHLPELKRDRTEPTMFTRVVLATLACVVPSFCDHANKPVYPELRASKLDAGVGIPLTLRKVDGIEMTKDQVKGYLQGKNCDQLCEKSNFPSNMFWNSPTHCAHTWDELASSKEYVAVRSDAMKKNLAPTPEYKVSFHINADINVI